MSTRENMQAKVRAILERSYQAVQPFEPDLQYSVSYINNDEDA